MRVTFPAKPFFADAIRHNAIHSRNANNASGD
jgi:hypothetical protein